MQQAVRPIKVEVSPQRNEAEYQNELDRMLARVDKGDNAVGECPEHHYLKTCPYRAGADDTPEDIVANLIVPEEFSVFAHPVRRPLVLISL